MAIIDIVLLIILSTFVISGYSFGLIRSVGSFIGTISGIFLATQWYGRVAQYLEPLFFGNTTLSKVLCFLLVLLIVDVVVTIVFYIIDKAVGWLPLIKGINKIGGIVFGFLKGAISISILVYIINLFPLWPFLVNQLRGSLVAPYLINVIAKVMPFLPSAIDGVKSIL